MDPEIQQLLKSLDMEAPPVRPKAELKMQIGSNVVPKKPFFCDQSRLFTKLSLCVLLVLGGVSVFLCVGGISHWFGGGKKVLRIQEAAEVGPISSLPSSKSLVVWSDGEGFPSELPKGSLGVDHLDILQAASGRKQALEEMRHDIDGLMSTCIRMPDRATAEALHRAVVRFDVADLDLTHNLISLIVSKKPLLRSSNDMQRLNETLSLVGLGRGLEEYSAAVAHVASSKKLAEESIAKLRSSRDIVRLAADYESVIQLLDGVYKNPVLLSAMNVEELRSQAKDFCRISLNRLLSVSSTGSRRCSSTERLAVAFLQREFSDISVEQWAKIDGALLSIKPSHIAVAAHNSLGEMERGASTGIVFLAPDVAPCFDPTEEYSLTASCQ